MAKQFDIRKKVSLVSVGEGWEEAYATFRPLGFEDLKAIQQMDNAKSDEDGMKAAEDMLTIIGQRFIEGKAPVDGALVELEADDFRVLPIALLPEIIKQLSGTLSPN